MVSVEYRYDDKLNVLFTRFFGVLIDKDLIDQAEAVAADPRIRPGARELVDLSDVEEVRGSPSSLELNIQIDSAHGDKLAGMRTAIAAGTDLMYGFARMYQSLAELRRSPLTIRVFRTVEDARKWLGLEDERP